MRERATWPHVKERTRKYQEKEPDSEPAHKAASRRDRTAAVASTRAVQRAAQMRGSMSLQDCSANCKLGDPASPHQPNHATAATNKEEKNVPGTWRSNARALGDLGPLRAGLFGLRMLLWRKKAPTSGRERSAGRGRVHGELNRSQTIHTAGAGVNAGVSWAEAVRGWCGALHTSGGEVTETSRRSQRCGNDGYAPQPDARKLFGVCAGRPSTTPQRVPNKRQHQRSH